MSVYGGDDNTVGTYTLDPKTHSVVKRGMGVFEYKDGKVTPKAFFGIGGDDFKTPEPSRAAQRSSASEDASSHRDGRAS